MLEAYDSFSNLIVNLGKLLEHHVVHIEVIHNNNSYNLSPEKEYVHSRKTLIEVETEQDTKVILQFALSLNKTQIERWEKIILQQWDSIRLIRKANY